MHEITEKNFIKKNNGIVLPQAKFMFV